MVHDASMAHGSVGDHRGSQLRSNHSRSQNSSATAHLACWHGDIGHLRMATAATAACRQRVDTCIPAGPRILLNLFLGMNPDPVLLPPLLPPS